MILLRTARGGSAPLPVAQLSRSFGRRAKWASAAAMHRSELTRARRKR